ncbi:hypothetical protein BU16DRAFT_572866 [Lophium mytilinum]|uniref:Uncharacterized protein n=1 Tax=Lophium mytilinum TaxID=390894 RepID=A0A6A6QTX7_9PEZI|nr:hypothetical protein BU16DRAFT_572866 [Lophium mytilinum]
MAYSVWLVSYLGYPRDHHGIFVETGPDQTGFLFQPAKKPENSTTYVPDSKTYLGTVSEANYARIQPVVETFPPPPKQFHGGKKIDLAAPIRRCQEWTADAIQGLRDQGVLET